MAEQSQSARMRALQSLSNQLPVANSRIAAGQQAARDMQVQQAVSQLPQGPRAAQQLGATAATQAGQQAVGQAQNLIKQQGQIGQLGVQQQQLEGKSEIAGLQAGARESEMANVQKLASISENAKRDLFDAEMQFAKDENGRTLFSNRQLADYARASAVSDEQFKNYQQKAEIANRRNIQALEMAYSKVAQDLEQKAAIAEQKGDFQTREAVARQKAEAERKMQEARNRANNNAAMWQTGGVIVGTAAGAVIGGPAGAMVGAQVGGAVGGMAGAQQSQSVK